MNHDRIHARKPSHDVEKWTVGTIGSIGERDGHCVVTVAVRDLFVGRLDLDDGESPVGCRVWYRQRGG
jgi:hypothetical protein